MAKFRFWLDLLTFWARGLGGVIRNKANIFCGQDECKFRMAKGAGSVALPDTFQVVPVDRLIRNLGQILTLGMGGVLRAPIKEFQLLGIDCETLKALEYLFGSGPVSLQSVMDFLGRRGYDQCLQDPDRRLGWTKVTTVMMRADGEEGGVGGSGGEPSFRKYIIVSGALRVAGTDA
eukprot:evm.model.scf_103EXC.1 EVM.evm.TU.scf_103EXC.1   scf_103EXC:23534-24753(-)